MLNIYKEEKKLFRLTSKMTTKDNLAARTL